MMSYQTFFGIDIGKYEFVSAIFGKKTVDSYTNDELGWSKFFRQHFISLKEALVVLETTGGYEQGLLDFLLEKGITVHRADTRKVKNFIRSYGQKAKTDKIDAIGIAHYAMERQSSLKPFVAHNLALSTLKLLEERRLDLTQMLVQEKNRAKAPLNRLIQKDIDKVISFLEKQISEISVRIKALIEKNASLQQKKKILLEIPGIGEKTAHSLMALVPELGHLDRKTIASLCGLAPHAKQSGTKTWYSRTGSGRRNLRPILFMSAMGARRTKSNLAEFYQRLVDGGKKKMVALAALMRKIVVIANARIRDHIILSGKNALTRT